MEKELRYIVGALIIGALLAGAMSVSAFVYPDTAPPNYSVANPVFAPLHVGDVGQQKIAGLGLCSGWSPTVVCLDVGGKIYAEGDLELETGIITPVDGSTPTGAIYLNAPGGVVLPSVSGSTVSGVANGTVIFDDDNNTLKVWIGGQWKEVATNP